MKVEDRSGLSQDELEVLESDLKRLHSLADVMVWGRQQPRSAMVPQIILDVVVQDEFTHDAIVPWSGRFIVFGST